MTPSSVRVAESLGYTGIKAFHAGMPAWKKAKGLVVSEPANVMQMMKDDASYVLIDTRDAKAAQKDHIKTAVSIPASKLASAKAMFPEDKGAPIILYTDGAPDVESFEVVRGWGYKNVSVLNGGTKGWVEANGKLFSGKLPTEFAYVKKLPKGQISIEEFTEVVEKQPKDKIILDVRDSSTARDGAFKGSLNIPSEELEGRMNEIPKDKEVLVHCNTGVLASSAYGKLKEKGYNIRFLDAVVQVDSTGSYEITEK